MQCNAFNFITSHVLGIEVYIMWSYGCCEAIASDIASSVRVGHRNCVVVVQLNQSI